MSSLFNKDYYENGITKGVSGYENFSYMPTRSYEEALSILDKCNIQLQLADNVLDFGCAKGFLVHTLRQLNINAYGEDISDYALKQAHPSVKKYLSKPTDKKYDFIICKDVLEHIHEDEIPIILKQIKNRCKIAFFVIPLGDNNKFRIREYEIDVTHVTKKDEDWWINQFNNAGFRLLRFNYKFKDVKKKWTSKYPYGNGFFEVSSK